MLSYSLLIENDVDNDTDSLLSDSSVSLFVLIEQRLLVHSIL